MTTIKQCILSKVEKEIIASLRKVNKNYRTLGRKNRKWTRAIKNAIGDVGKKRGNVVYASECKFWKNGEWMCDLVWSKESEKKDHIFRLTLALESEWDPKDILWDFSKLMVIRADLRVMIFWGRTPEKANQNLNAMLDQVRKYKGNEIGDRYLFICWIDLPEDVTASAYEIR